MQPNKMFITPFNCRSLVVLVVIYCLALSKGYKDLRIVKNVDAARDAKLFPIIRIEPGPCVGMNNIGGVCYSSSECTRRGGTAMGSCGRGFGTCCHFEVRCALDTTSVSANENQTYLLNPMGGSASSTCMFDINKAHDVCQLRLDFETFSLDPPDVLGECSVSSMSIVGSNTVSSFRLCGNQLPNPRMYLAYGSSNRISVNFKTATTNTYRVKVTQIKCIHQRVPNQCLQFHETDADTVKSFGWPMYMINNQQYTVCANKVADLNGIVWSECDDPAHMKKFFLSRYFSDAVEPPNSLGTVGAIGILSCSTTSYVDIIGGERHCGNYFLPAPLATTTNTGPFMLGVRFVVETFTSLTPLVTFEYIPVAANTTYPCATGNGYTCTPGTPATGQTHVTCVCIKKATITEDPPPIPAIRRGFCLKYAER